MKKPVTWKIVEKDGVYLWRVGRKHQGEESTYYDAARRVEALTGVQPVPVTFGEGRDV